MIVNQRALGVSVAAAVCVMVTGVEQAHATRPDKEFTIAAGETISFSSRGIQRVVPGNDTVINVRNSSDGRQIEVTGLKEGTTTVMVYSSSDQKTLLIRVVPINPLVLADEAGQILDRRSGVGIRVVNGRVLLEGEVASETYKRRIEELVKLYPNQILNFTTYRESFVEGAKMVALEMDFVQLAVTDRDNLGVKWGQFIGSNFSFGTGDVPLFYGESAAIGDGILPREVNPARLPRAITLTGGNSLTSYFSMVGNLNTALDFMVDHGMIKTRQHGIMVTEAGTEGEYHVGGTLLVRTASLNAVNVLRIPYGMRLKATPIVDLENRVKISIEISFDELDNANGIDGIPALRSAEMKGVVNMQEGQSVLISGITSTQETSGEQGWWLLSRIPILGWVFKSRSYVGQQLDNALFITPRLYEPGGKTHNTLVRGVFEEMLKEGVDATELPKLSNAPATTSRPASGPTTPTPTTEEGGSADDIEFGE